MAFQEIDLGTRGNNQTGDDVNEAGVKINANFQELYNTKLEGVTGGTGITIDNTDPLNPVINGSSTITNTSDLVNDGSDGNSTYVENDELGALALLDTVSTSEIDDSSVTLAKMANANAFSIIGNNTASPTAPLYLTTAQVRSLLNVEDGAAANQTLSIVGDQLTISGSGGNTITIPTGGGGVVVDSVITNGSNNPVTNNAIRDALVDINSFVAAGNIEADKIQDGAGSGLDADTIDGIQLSNIARTDIVETFDQRISVPYITSTFSGESNANNIVTTITNGNSLIITSNSTGSTNFATEFGQSLIVRGDTDNRSFALFKANGDNAGFYLGNYNSSLNDWQWNQVWHAGNGGSGSGLNADLLDNIQSTSFLRSDVADNLEANLNLTTGKIIFNGNANSNISNTGGDGEINIPTSGAFRFKYNNTQLVQFNGNGFQVLNGANFITTNESYGSSWNGNNEVPTKSALYSKIESLGFPTYATGNFTPTFIDAGGGATYSTNGTIGEYTRIGNLVTLTIFANINSTTGTPTGEFRISGLPSFGGSGTVYSGVGTVEMYGISQGAPNTANAIQILSSHVVVNNSANGYLTLNRDTQAIGVMQPMENVSWNSGQITITITCTL